MAHKASVVIEKDEHGFYTWRPELRGCQSQGATFEEAIQNIKEAIELYLETVPADERDVLLSRVPQSIALPRARSAYTRHNLT